MKIIVMNVVLAENALNVTLHGIIIKLSEIFEQSCLETAKDRT